MSEMEFREPNEVLWHGVRPAHKGIQVQKYFTVVNTSVLMHSVTAGKVFYLTSWNIGFEVANAGDDAYFRINTPAPVYWFIFGRILSQLVSGAQLSGNFWPPLEVPASHTIYLIAGGLGSTAYGSIHGWEE